jgi:hypothetical protein
MSVTTWPWPPAPGVGAAGALVGGATGALVGGAAVGDTAARGVAGALVGDATGALVGGAGGGAGAAQPATHTSAPSSAARNRTLELKRLMGHQW